MGRPSVARSGAPNGPPGSPVRPMTDGWLPTLVTSMVILAVWPTGTGPKWTTAGVALNLVIGARPVPVRVTVTGLPRLGVMVNDPLLVTLCRGVKTTSTGIASPGLMTVPTLGRPVTL